MTGLEKILAEIKAEAEAEARQTLAAANAKAEELLLAARTEAEAIASAEKEASAHKTAEIAQSSNSAISLQRRQRILGQKRMLIEETLDKARKSLCDLPDDEYFALLAKLASNNAHAGSGTLLLNEKDLSRLPAAFKSQLAAVLPQGSELTVGEQTRPIDGGFVLAYGDVEENCSFAAIFDTRADEFSDLICDTLFA